jgi:glycosyltransferase involved in cell wall biosynthesis
MNILLAHNFYNSANPSGENVVFRAEAALLREHGHRVAEFTRSSDELLAKGALGKMEGALLTPWNPAALRQGKEWIRRAQPEILHVHNTFPRLSPAIFHAANGGRVATVLTLHNYRTVCAAAIPMRGTTVCTECLDRHQPWPAMKYGCYRQSRLATLPLVLMIALHHRLGTWRRHVDAFIALTAFQKNQLTKAGLPGERIFIKPQFYPDPPQPLPWPDRKRKVVYIGRVSPEKGLQVLLDAWRLWPGAPPLEIIGDGPAKATLQAQVEGLGQAEKIRFLGQIPFAEAQKHLANASLMILPTLWFEGFPMVIREAFALGVPIAGSRIGSISELVGEHCGTLFTPGDPQDLVAQVRRLWTDADRLGRSSQKARSEFEIKYTAEANYRILAEIYRQAKAHRLAGTGLDAA